MDKILKALNKLSPKERNKIKSILVKLRSNNVVDLDVKKLKNREDIFRIRKGDLRIVYKKNKSGINLLAIERRSDNTYK